MQIKSREKRLIRNTEWLIKLRWIAISVLLLFIVFSYFTNSVYTKYTALLLIGLGLSIENVVAILFVEKIKKHNLSIKYTFYNLYFQIIDDLLFLTLILHFTGGVENPLYLIYIFHMVIASVMLSRRDAISISALSVSLFGLLIYFEYLGLIPHNCLCIDFFPDLGLYYNLYYVNRVFFSFLLISIILVYLASTLGLRLRKQEEQLNKAVDKLKDKDKIKNEYVLRLNHDIKNHLSAIQTNLSVLTTNVFGEMDENKAKFVNLAYNRTVKLTEFVKQLLHLTKLRLKDEEPRYIFSIKEVIEDLITDYTAEAKKNNVEIESWIDPQICDVKGNKFSIKEALDNLISNAVKYTPDGGVVEIVAVCKNDHMKLEIRDEGIGIPDEDKEKIFNEFYRASNAKQSSIEGTGVGLSLTRQIILNHGGVLNLENRKPKGTRFTVLLPNNK